MKLLLDMKIEIMTDFQEQRIVEDLKMLINTVPFGQLIHILVETDEEKHKKFDELGRPI